MNVILGRSKEVSVPRVILTNSKEKKVTRIPRKSVGLESFLNSIFATKSEFSVKYGQRNRNLVYPFTCRHTKFCFRCDLSGGGGWAVGGGQAGEAGADGLQTSVRGLVQVLHVFSCGRWVAGMAQCA